MAAANAHHRCGAVNLRSKQSRFYLYLWEQQPETQQSPQGTPEVVTQRGRKVRKNKKHGFKVGFFIPVSSL